MPPIPVYECENENTEENVKRKKLHIALHMGKVPFANLLHCSKLVCKLGILLLFTN